LGHGDAEPAAFRHRLIKRTREGTVGVACEPVRVIELFDDGSDAFADRIQTLPKPLFFHHHRALSPTIQAKTTECWGADAPGAAALMRRRRARQTIAARSASS